MTKLYAIEFEGFRAADGSRFLANSQRAADYLPGYDMVRFVRADSAQDYIDSNCVGIITAQFRVIESEEEGDFARAGLVCAGDEGDDDYDEGYISQASDICRGSAVPVMLVAWKTCTRSWTPVEDLRDAVGDDIRAC
jgi:hypothetical protein